VNDVLFSFRSQGQAVGLKMTQYPRVVFRNTCRYFSSRNILSTAYGAGWPYRMAFSMSITELAVVEGPLAAAYLLALVALAFGIIPVSERRTLVARNCLIGSCAIFAGIAIMWAVMTELTPLPRLLVVFLLCGLAGIGTVEGTRFIMNEVKPKENHGPKVTVHASESFAEAVVPINDQVWTSLLVVADQARQANDGTALAKRTQGTRADVLAFYAARLNEVVQLYGVMPPSPRSEPITLRGDDQIKFVVNGAQFDSTDPNGRPLYRFIHLRTADVPAGLAKIHDMAAAAVRGPTLEATNRSKIDATNAIIPGDLPFQFGKADQDSIIDIPGIQVTKNENGTYTVMPGARPVNRQFPPPTGEFSSLSNAALSKKVQSVISELRQFNSDYRRDVFPPYTRVGPIDEEYTRRSTENWNKYRAAYEERFTKLTLSLTSEMLARIGSIEGDSMSQSAREAATLVYYGRFAGNNTAAGAADFLEAVASKLPNK